jgi:hypothetical protein
MRVQNANLPSFAALQLEPYGSVAQKLMAAPPATLYVLSAGVDDLYKIGRTKGALDRRVSQLNTGAARKLTVVVSFPVPTLQICKCEAFVHASLRDISAPEAGGKEFFRCADQEVLKERVQGAWCDFLKCCADVHDAIEEKSRLVGIFEKRSGLAADMKRLEVHKTLIEETLLAVFEDGYSEGERQLLSWQKRSWERFDLDAFRQDHPELAAQYTKTRVTRTPVFH